MKRWRPSAGWFALLAWAGAVACAGDFDPREQRYACKSDEECAGGYTCGQLPGGLRVCIVAPDGLDDRWRKKADLDVVVDTETNRVWTVSPVLEKTLADGHAHCRDDEDRGEGGAQWELPSVNELRMLIDGCPETAAGSTSCNVGAPSCTAADCATDCAGCPPDCQPPCRRLQVFEGPCGFTWSSTKVQQSTTHSWGVDFCTGGIGSAPRDESHHVLCVHRSPP